MSDFKVGDRVRLVYNSSMGRSSEITKETGRAKLTGVIKDTSGDKACTVELDNPELAKEYIRLWGCGDIVPSGNGRIIPKCCLVLHEEEVTGVLSITEGDI